MRAPHLQLTHLGQQIALLLASTQHGAHRIEHGAEGAALQLAQALLQGVWKLQQPQGVPCRRGVKHHGAVVQLLDQLQDLCKRHGLVDAGDRAHEILQEASLFC